MGLRSWSHVHGVGCESTHGSIHPQDVDALLGALIRTNGLTFFVGAPGFAQFAKLHHGHHFGRVLAGPWTFGAFGGLLNLCAQFRPLGGTHFVLFPGHSVVNSASWALVKRVLNTRAWPVFTD